jgi:hypothetical protein
MNPVMNRGLIVINVIDNYGRPGAGALVGLGTVIATGGQGSALQIFRENGIPWVNPHETTNSDGIAIFFFSWDQTQIGEATSVQYTVNVAAAPAFRSFVHKNSQLQLVSDITNLFHGSMPEFHEKGTPTELFLKSSLRLLKRAIGDKGAGIHHPHFGTKFPWGSTNPFALVGAIQIVI